ncbi:LysR family transcriptional regulator [Janthinobacterium agaricidamnosum]|uniref:Bacterial regulatory helix-turn-helix, lysR family protein n=1 Tax=Janthinobacterium agaricidamnosum NBRC 102515 = DSM 9628 TaxID=1349767 RepID=W0V985_9BURK|nr:LysR family transcriptional regulator [Janthinobacterium agaricidamnosum]CDG83908.1 bacterial regulatory helix-turn-helix, lysR family protein [Janthinobacterium agaricidamnosum NBRC 102515 = DSM 9628]
MNNGLYEHIEVFLAIVQAGSLTGAAITTGIGQATISRQLAALEAHLGGRLFLRSTRAISLTERGETFREHALRLRELMQQAQAAPRENGTLRGRIRVACSHGFAKKLLIPMLPEWQRLHPEVEIELLLADNVLPVVVERVDLAFRSGRLRESGLVARQVGAFEHIVVAAPAYLRRHGVPLAPRQLAAHQCILFSGWEQPASWRFGQGASEVTVEVVSRLRISTLDAIQDAVLAGLGIAIMPEWFWRAELEDGRVLRLLADHALETRSLSVVSASRHAPDSKYAVFSAFVEHMLDTLSYGKRDGK